MGGSDKRKKKFTVQGRDTPVPVGVVGERAGHPRRLSVDCKASAGEVDPRPPLSGPTSGKKDERLGENCDKVPHKAGPSSCTSLANGRSQHGSTRRKNALDLELDRDFPPLTPVEKDIEIGSEDPGSGTDLDGELVSPSVSDVKDSGEEFVAREDASEGSGEKQPVSEEEEKDTEPIGNQKTIQLSAAALHNSIREKLGILRQIMEQICGANKQIYDYSHNTRNVAGLLKKGSETIRNQVERLDVTVREITDVSTEAWKTYSTGHFVKHMLQRKKQNSDTGAYSLGQARKAVVRNAAAQTMVKRLERTDIGIQTDEAFCVHMVNKTDGDLREGFKSQKGKEIPLLTETVLKKKKGPMKKPQKDENPMQGKAPQVKDASPRTENAENQSPLNLQNEKSELDKCSDTSLPQSDTVYIEVSKSRKKMKAARASIGASPLRRVQETNEKPLLKRKNEAIMVKVQKEADFKKIYRQVLDKAKDILRGTLRVRKTREGHVLFELNKETQSRRIAEEVKTAIGGTFQVNALRSITTLEVRNLDPFMEKEDVQRSFSEAFGITSVQEVKVKSLYATYTGTLRGIIEVPNALLPRNIDGCRFRTGFNSAAVKVLPNVVRCFRCHNFGHISYVCRELSSDQERCRRCGSLEHRIVQCEQETRCFLCTEKGMKGHKVRHVAGSQICPCYKSVLQEARAGRQR
ncbi:hypothetical protein WN51_13275 [Melipona quadrifasciata]|uniref:CCHC-type domain-containing protein n=1 Tax=Melipona quadrifasciata TaxID=166423 RepID=A0A0N0BGS9_9HYME|nr:hypothetical protein WN51_13275 [Melipona quadrifasciata]